MKQVILILGGEGLLGHDLAHYLKKIQDFEVISLGKNKADITNQKELESLWRTVMPQVVINCGAYTNVDLAETERDKCRNINTDAVQNIINLSSKYKTKMIQISTASVLGSSKHEELSNSAKPSPVNYYSETKAMAEKLCNTYANQGGCIYILRTYWLYGSKKSDFVSFVRKSLEEGNQTRIVFDQYGQPTSTHVVSQIIKLILLEDILPGTYPATATGSTSRIEWANKIAELLNLDKKFLAPISSKEFQAAAIRPINATLSHKVWQDKKIGISHWQDALEAFLNGIPE